MKRAKIKDDINISKQSEYASVDGDDAINESIDVNTIQEFVDLKKLQNRILEKMLKNINPSENQNKPNNK